MKKAPIIILSCMLIIAMVTLVGCGKISEKVSELEAQLLDAEVAYEQGLSEGHDSGYGDGYSAGKADATTENYQNGYGNGYSAGYQAGLAEGKAYTSSKTDDGTITLGTIGMEVHFIDVGQGDAIVIRFADGTDIIVDAGSGTSEDSDVTTAYINYLKAIDIGTIDCLIATHAHSDHMNMLDNVLDSFTVNNIWYNGYDTAPTQNYFTTFETKVTAEGANVVKFDSDGDTYNLKTGEYNVTVYAPGYDAFSDINYESPMILVEYAGVKVLLTGDAEEDAEKAFTKSLGAESLDVDVLKVGHHGSKKSTCTEFLKFITPEFAVISAGDGNSYGHPTPATMNDLFDSGIITYRTDRQGDIVLKVDSEGNFAFYVENYVPVDNNRLWLADRMIANK